MIRQTPVIISNKITNVTENVTENFAENVTEIDTTLFVLLRKTNLLLHNKFQSHWVLRE